DKSYKKDDRLYFSFTEHIAKNKDENKKLVVKIDIEGAEWDSLLATSDAVLSNINQLGIEFHDLLEGDPKYTALIKKLKKTFYIVNIHYNNWRCTPKSKFFPASVNEILFVNKKAGIIDKTAPEPVLPHPLDSPNNPELKDCQ
ncbi:MAG: hypothetical protein GY754_28090, partial [bacterium]|nr:hypothetical protein [bacterium]